MLSEGLDYLKVMNITGLPKKDVLKIQSELKMSADAAMETD